MIKKRGAEMSYKSETFLTVRYAETDMMGIVHHSRYYPWFEQARTDFIKKSGITYTQMEQAGVLLPLAETHCKYIAGLKNVSLEHLADITNANINKLFNLK